MERDTSPTIKQVIALMKLGIPYARISWMCRSTATSMIGRLRRERIEAREIRRAAAKELRKEVQRESSK